ncbi:glycosyltransferase [Vacuolonema iberomarrocanum]|uniref:glycosyltransferase n=1 Tax=Vacuolonema iberomarrocanum TaxID=3454632 RepID=UPI0019F10B4A|nr:glycosyltransferase family 1 protein [filamentous cyanobacterium LEGE 07170]
MDPNLASVSSTSPPLSPLPALLYPVYFVFRKEKTWDDVMKQEMPPPIEAVYDRFKGASDAWGPQTYIQLKRRGLGVHLVPDFVPGALCVTTYEQLTIKSRPYSSYVACCRHDRGRPEICEQRVVQNHLNLIDETDHLMPLWPQPCLQPRDASRQARVENLVFKGRTIYLAKPFRTPSFLDALQDLGIQLKVSPDDPVEAYKFWTDYSDADVVIAVRNCTDYDLSIKPPSKLVNSWMAGVPAILGPEPAYQNLRESELDYFEVRSADEAIAALKRLKEEPGLYQAMVENGLRRAQDFTADRIAERWRNLLAGPITEGYEKWLAQSAIQKMARPLQFGIRCVKHKMEKRTFEKNIHDGARMFPE